MFAMCLQRYATVSSEDCGGPWGSEKFLQEIDDREYSNTKPTGLNEPIEEIA